MMLPNMKMLAPAMTKLLHSESIFVVRAYCVELAFAVDRRHPLCWAAVAPDMYVPAVVAFTVAGVV